MRMSRLRKKLNAQSGFALSLEMVILATFVLCVGIIGWSSMGAKLVAEMGDIGGAIGDLNQSYTTTGMAVGHPGDANHPQDIATWSGSSHQDFQDFCDNDPNCACGVRVCIPPTAELPHSPPVVIPP